MINYTTSKVRHLFQIYDVYLNKMENLQKQFQKYDRIGEHDYMIKELIQVFIVKLMNNMVLKFKSQDKDERYDAYMSAKLLCVLSNQFLNKTKIHDK